ncbi:MAG: hypothetical protein RSC14_13035, partial [Niameybacter sp.]
MKAVYQGNTPISKVYQGDVLIQDYTDVGANANEVPYIATYYVEPIVDLNDEIIISYYVTDYFQREYKEDDARERFTLDYWVGDSKRSMSNIKPGDNTINLGKLAVGKQLIALQVTDRRGRKSHRLFQEICVIDKIKDKGEQVVGTYQVTENDLKNFNIAANNTKPVETTKGLNEIIKFAAQKGYRKLVLPLGTYRIDENTGIKLERFNQFTLDLNGSTMKLNPNALAKCMMITIQDCYDCHVVNGIIEGDVREHDFANAPNSAEWVNAVTINGGSYNSFEDLQIKDVTGYGTSTMFGSDTIVGAAGGFGFALGDIVDGKWVDSTERYSSQNFVSLSDYRMDLKPPKEKYDYTRKGFFQLGAYLGYQGNVTDNWVYKATFYDGNKNYLTTIEGYAYRRLYVPKDAKFVRITLYSSLTPSSAITLFSIDMPLNCKFKNIYHKNIRAVGMAPTSFNNLLVEGCTFEECGYALAKCAFDAEDGWDMMQDLTFRKNKFTNNPHNNFLTCAGHNIIVEDNENIGMYFWERTRSYVVRNNVISLGGNYRYQSMTRTGYVRIQNNTNISPPQISLTDKQATLVIKNENYIHCTPYTRSNYVSENEGVKVVDSVFEYDPLKGVSGAPRYTQFIRCQFNNYKAYLSDESIYRQCIFNNALDLRLHGATKKQFIECQFNNCWMKAQGAMDAIFDKCKMVDMTLY